MAKINILPKHLAELIAAGEVVERPSSVVKELIENSIDAGADRITVEIKNGGIRFIRITDNGCGIGREDIRSAFISHATSKIKISEDLEHILTLGFRGEALASIASVARVEVLTKEASAVTGTRYVIEGSEEKLCDDAGCPDGTTIMIRDIFYNTPARMKFLKKDATEGNYISDVVEKIAVSHPEISFKLIKDNKAVIVTNGNGDLHSVIYSVYGKDFASNLIECEYELSGIKVKGFVSKPTAGRATRSMQFVYVNGRYVRIPVVASALDNAYKNSVMVGKYPTCVLFLTMSPELVDVNVHPAKTEVRFSDDRKIYEVVYYGALSSLNGDKSVIKAKLTNKNENVSEIINKGTKIHQLKMSEDFSPKSVAEYIQSENIQPIKEEIVFEENKTEEIPEINITVPTPVKPMMTQNRKLDITFDENDIIPKISDEPLRLRDESRVEISYGDDDGLNLDALMKKEEKKEPEPEIIITDEAQKDNRTVEFGIVGEVFNTYIIVETGNKMYFVDKHAAHERILFNELKERKNHITSQLLLCPVTVNLSRREYEAVTDNLDVFKDAGYGVEDFGEGCVAVRECPIDLSGEDITYIVNELAGQLVNQSKVMMPQKLEWLYHSTACRAAVKAGDSLTETEKEALVRQVLTDDNVRFCPHGRPVMIEMSRYELEKQFGRIQ